MGQVRKGAERGRRPGLRAVREGFRLSQVELAISAGVSASTIQALEQGSRRPQPRTARQIAQALGVEVGEIAW